MGLPDGARTNPRPRLRQASAPAGVVSFTLEDRPAAGDSSKTVKQQKFRVLTVILARPDAVTAGQSAAKK